MTLRENMELREKLNTVSREIYEISKLIDDFMKIRDFDMVRKLINVLTLKEYEAIKLKHYRDWETDRKSTRLNSSHSAKYRMPSSA